MLVVASPVNTRGNCFTLLHSVSLHFTFTLGFTAEEMKFCRNKQHCWLVPIDSTHTKTCCVRFHFLRKYPVSQKLLTVLLVTQSHPLDLSQSGVLVYQEEPCRGQILSLASKLKAPQSRLSHEGDRRAAAACDLGLCLCALRRSRPDWCARAHKPCSATRSSHRVF